MFYSLFHVLFFIPCFYSLFPGAQSEDEEKSKEEYDPKEGIRETLYN